MNTIAPGLFSRAVFGEAQKRNAAAEGLTQTFATILARQMHQSSDGDEEPMGINGGIAGDIYGGFIDEALGKVLAHSPAMKSLNQALERELAGGAATSKTSSMALNRTVAGSVTPAVLMAGTAPAVPSLDTLSAGGMLQTGASGLSASDNRGPLLLPPAPDLMAPTLPAPTSLKG